MADTTSLNESSQALFCALADYARIKGKNLNELFDAKDKELKTFTLFEKKWKSVFKGSSESLMKIYDKFTDAEAGSTKISYGEIEGYLMTNNDWYISSALIGKKLVEDITKISKGFSKKPSINEVWYFRGDPVIMKNLEELFKIAKKNQPAPQFGDINKWSPADIYFATEIASRRIQSAVDVYVSGKKTGYGFDILNKMISDLIVSGDLLPLSLKKQTNNVHLVKVNFDKVDEQIEILKYQYYGLRQPWVKYTLNKPATRDLQIKFSTNDREGIKLRHDASTNGFKAEFESRDMEARGGSIGSIKVFCDILSLIDKPFANKLLALYNKGAADYIKKVKPLREELESKLKRLKTEDAKKIAKKEFDAERGGLSAMEVTNKIFPPLIEWLDKNSKSNSKSKDFVPLADRFVQEMFKYITSRSSDSGKFVIAK
jgi:hypothetical protein